MTTTTKPTSGFRAPAPVCPVWFIKHDFIRITVFVVPTFLTPTALVSSTRMIFGRNTRSGEHNRGSVIFVANVNYWIG